VSGEHDHVSEAHGDGARGFTRAEAHQVRRLGVVLGLTSVFAGLELAGAVAARSQVLLADGVHLLLDVVALGLSIAAMRLAVRPPTDRFTFGLRRIEPVAAVLNAILVLLASWAIVHEAASDLATTTSPRPTLMLIVATAALFVHGWSAWLIHDAIEHHEPGPPHAHEHAPRQHGHALNLRGVWLHLVGDTLGAIAAVVAAVVIRLGGPAVVDPIGGLLVALLLALGAFKLLRDAVLVLLDAAPAHLPTRVVREVVSAESGVAAIVHLRVWTLGAGHDAVALKVRSRSADLGLADRLSHRLRHDLGVELVTVEVAPPEPTPGGGES
jgi:cobalt-zinc-cadmium efflux system protein